MACRVLNIKLKLWTMDGTVSFQDAECFTGGLFICVFLSGCCCEAALSSDKLGIGNELKAAWC